jgi:hypothetical protein
MRVQLNFAGLRGTALHEYAIRFLFGGLITVIAGLVAKEWGPRVGGLLLAFPAIFPASATLIERHQIQRKHKAGQHGARRGRQAAALDAAGAAMGCFGLFVFGLLVFLLLPNHSPWMVLMGGLENPRSLVAPACDFWVPSSSSARILIPQLRLCPRTVDVWLVLYH